jgi:hypothetical protein
MEQVSLSNYFAYRGITDWFALRVQADLFLPVVGSLEIARLFLWSYFLGGRKDFSPRRQAQRSNDSLERYVS